MTRRRVQDLRAGKAAGLPTIGCLFAYGDAQALRHEGPSVVVAVRRLMDLVGPAPANSCLGQVLQVVEILGASGLLFGPAQLL